VLGLYAAHQLQLLKTIEAKEYVDRRKIYKSLPTTQHVRCEDTDLFFLNRYGLSVREAEECLSKSLTDNLTDCVDYSHINEFAKVDL
jgi:hypothetical protein